MHLGVRYQCGHLYSVSVLSEQPSCSSVSVLSEQPSCSSVTVVQTDDLFTQRSTQSSIRASLCTAECCMLTSKPNQPKDDSILHTAWQQVGGKNEYRLFQNNIWYNDFPWITLCTSSNYVSIFSASYSMNAMSCHSQ